jgi:Ca2+-binding EF-hand superfamily protein
LISRYVHDDVERRWGRYDQDGDDKITWDGYVETSYGMVKDKDAIYDHRRGLTFNQAIERDRKRFFLADRNGDKIMTKEEYGDFLHPHDVPHMRDLVVDETMWDMDKNKDGFVDLNEFVIEIWQDQDGEEPEWLKVEKQHFHTHRDKNGDERLDREEIGNWIRPVDFDPALSEAKHLLYEGDVDKDTVLSKKEILDNQSLFVGSQATDWGNYFVRHDEF